VCAATDDNDPYTEEKARILDAALIEADFDGWSLETLRRAADKAGLGREAQRLAFPRGVMDLVAYYSQRMDDAMEVALASRDLSSLKVREKIALAVRLRIEALGVHKPAAQRALQFLTLPPFAGEGIKNLYRTVDRIWRAAGDTSSDFNFYTKRVLLAGVYAATLAKWLEDESEGSQASWAFLARRIEDVMRIEKAKRAALKALSNLPSPVDVLAGLRYPRRS
jgi:ubiquinone biosynthesis protein COQ9